VRVVLVPVNMDLWEQVLCALCFEGAVRDVEVGCGVVVVIGMKVKEKEGLCGGDVKGLHWMSTLEVLMELFGN
jgi:hypothetical protein